VKHVFHPEAAAEFEEAVRFYQRRGTGLGKRFSTEVRVTIKKILQTPERWRILDQDVRRCLTRIFPYSVLYTIETDFILIVAVMHGRREPGYWKQRLNTKPRSL
jgi:plasmid stabilization system protein ParE